jgi:16S rRNA (guanine966-N2)-methyltransferase
MRNKLTQQIRIIGGKWRSRKINFPALADIRPTSDRVRETLFNWLSPVMADAYCLDLFAGSGALGFEALSRGAAHVVMVDKSPVVIEHLRDLGKKLAARHFTVYQGKVPESVFLPPQVFNIVFLDPPFYQNLIYPSIAWLQEKKFINSDSLIYVEV